MYEKHITGLKIERIGATGDKAEALDAAIALMRSAEPKDEAAERERLRADLERWCDAKVEDLEVTSEHLDWLQAQTAAARAEVEAKYQAMLAPKDEAAEREHCLNAERVWSHSKDRIVADQIMLERAAARAEVAREYGGHTPEWWAAVAADLDAVRAALRTMSENEGKLQARIAELETSVKHWANETHKWADKAQERHTETVELSTKLTALREAAERAEDALQSSLESTRDEAVVDIRAAIEASKK